MNSKIIRARLLQLAAAAVLSAITGAASAAGLSIADNPLFLNSVVAPLNMLVVGRDHKLFYEAYADHSDLDGDGTLDVGYHGFDTKADGTFKIDYYGYFDSYKCYEYSSNMFVPVSATSDKKCAGKWSGDWLNWATTARIDALRKVLYGGKRSTDTSSETVLERSLIPQDAHSWGKEYTSTAVDGYNIADVTPYSQPAANTRHFFANTTLMTTTDWTTNTGPPEFRVLLNQPSPRRIWNWVSKESPLAGGSIDTGSGNVSVSPSVFNVRVKVCVNSGGVTPESNCKQYPDGNWKPTGLLQDFGENDTMLFGLLTGSYAKSKSGGVLRKNMGTIKDEINSTTDGTLKSLVGIIRTMDQLRPAGYTNYTSQSGGYGTVYPPGLVTTRPFNEGEFGGNWGNPVAEMMYEALRYFAGKTGPTSAFDYSTGIDATAPLSLPKASSWSNPYASGKPSCAKPFQTVISDINTSYDSDQVPGSYFNGFTGDLAGLNVSTEANTIWGTEFGATGNYFIGQSGAVYDGAPTPKSVSSFSSIRGLSPEEPTKEGSYYAASVAAFGLKTDLNGRTGDQKAQTFAIALASPLPRIEIPVGGRNITLVPFAKSVAGASISASQGSFQPTNQIVDFYVENIAADRKSGTFQVNFEDVEAGNDHDMDAISRYTYQVNADNTVTVTVSSDYAAGGIVQHMGYVISGSTRDGIYLEVRDKDTNSDTDYFLDTPPAFTGTPPAPNTGSEKWNDGVNLPLVHSRTFSPGSSNGAGVLKDPLWYAAKWGGFEDTNSSNTPDLQAEWDKNGDGNPDNYFLVTNALKLGEQLTSAFKEIVTRTGSASSASVNTGSISSDTRVYQAKFNSGDWRGQLLSFPVNTDDGTLQAAEWDAADKLNAQSATSRVIITNNSDTSTAAGVPFRWTSLSATRQAALAPLADGRGEARLDYLRGDDTQEQKNGGLFRNRVTKLGDIVSSSPVFVGKPAFAYPDTLESQPYSTFVANNADRQKMVYVGANDGMLHGFDAGTGASMGQERLAFIPKSVFANLHELTKPEYTHRFFVDGTPTIGDAFYGGAWHTVLVGSLNKGGRGIFALDVTNPANFSEANAASILRWEYTHADLGYTYSRPAIVRTKAGWAAVFGNGYNNSTSGAPTSTSGRAALFIVNIENGTLIRRLATSVGSTGTPNGLATPAVVDIDGDSIVDYAFAGDLRGNLWKFDLTDASASNWNVMYGNTPLVTAKDALGNAQPITSKPEVGRGPKGQGMIVLFGTGKFLEQADKTPTQTQTFYGVIDKNTGLAATDQLPATARSVLTAQTIVLEDVFSFTKPDGTSVSVPLRVTSDNALAANARGWYMDLLAPPNPPGTFQGEMQVSNSVLRNGRIIFTTLIPDADPCSPGGSSWLMEMDALTGSRLLSSPFDPNDDGVFSETDFVTITLPDGSVITVPASGIKSEVGIAQGPGILFDPGTGGEGAKEYKYLSGSNANAAGSNLQRVVENPGPNSSGRQSWRQVK